jgi:hypothetical protein
MLKKLHEVTDYSDTNVKTDVTSADTVATAAASSATADTDSPPH